MSKITYTIKKGKSDGDFEITMHGLETTFSIKDKLLGFNSMKNLLKEVQATVNIIKAEMKNFEVNHPKAFTMFKKLSPQDQLALKMWVINEDRLKEEEVKNAQFKKDYKQTERQLKEINKAMAQSPVVKKLLSNKKK